MNEEITETCHDCGVAIGELHLIGCDVPLCTVCGEQLLCCPHLHTGNTKWTGYMYPELREICEERGLYCIDATINHVKIWHIPCKRDMPGASYDYNKAGLIYADSKNPPPFVMCIEEIDTTNAEGGALLMAIRCLGECSEYEELGPGEIFDSLRTMWDTVVYREREGIVWDYENHCERKL